MTACWAGEEGFKNCITELSIERFRCFKVNSELYILANREGIFSSKWINSEKLFLVWNVSFSPGQSHKIWRSDLYHYTEDISWKKHLAHYLLAMQKALTRWTLNSQPPKEIWYAITEEEAIVEERWEAVFPERVVSFCT